MKNKGNRVVWGVVVFVFLLMVVGKRPFTLLAHSELTKSEPASGAMLNKTPSEIRLTFGEPLMDGSTFQLFGENFQRITPIAPVIDDQSSNQLVSSLPTLADGTYTVQWNTVVADGHGVSGSYSFTIVAQSGVGWGWITAVILGTTLLIRGKENCLLVRMLGKIEI